MKKYLQLIFFALNTREFFAEKVALYGQALEKTLLYGLFAEKVDS